ncbi:type-F conjugative transfer system mating-pair stabilization protein TraN [Serratia fonticola]|uniref:type-F conjugative transfer system mating-pair stabilization protein TraN n=1 Tax=Serratia fonticola TaxID=47917 RepID=UPI001AEB968A|nr:type-F conjugative transfer system mating-pair stabilization protein TraN [Serratia fonticola]MBP1038924.1 type-F conjugative transfer system mating-pair stabilization protein TraN [Serratia fonticola]
MRTLFISPWLSLVLGLLVMPLSSANEMDNAMKEGQGAGSSALSSGVDAAKKFKPQDEFSGFTSSPPETGYYGGGTQTSTNLGDKGNEALATSDMGKMVSESFINNPADKIDWNSDIIQNSNTIRENAEVIAAGTSPQCVRQELSKVSFTNHSCFQGKNISATCTRTAQINWNLQQDYELQTVEFEMLNQPAQNANGRVTATITPGISGEIVSATYSWKGNGSRNASMNIDVLGTSIGWSGTGGATNVSFSPSPSYFTAGVPFFSSHPNKAGNITFGSKHTQLTLRFTIRVTIMTWQPYISWTENCPIDKSNAVKLREWCSQPGGTKMVERDGRSYPLYSDCWQYSEEWQVSEQDDNTCQTWEKDPNCTVGTRQCTEYIGNYCVKENLTYQCQHTAKSEGWLCGEQFYCSDGSCVGIQNNSNGDFGDAVSKLAALAAAGKDVAEMDPSMVRAFTGKAMSCRKAAAGFSNCCKGGGWGSDVGLAHCNSEETAIGKAKEKLLTIDVGEYCSTKVLGVCLQKKRSYCVFESKLARIVQEQGRRGQLGVGFGSASSPDCRGVLVDELQRIDFGRLDFTDFYSDLQSNTQLPDQPALIERVKEQIASQLTGGGQ